MAQLGPFIVKKVEKNCTFKGAGILSKGCHLCCLLIARLPLFLSAGTGFFNETQLVSYFRSLVPEEAATKLKEKNLVNKSVFKWILREPVMPACHVIFSGKACCIILLSISSI